MRVRELNVPSELIVDVSRLIQENELPAQIMGVTDDDDIILELQYEKENSSVVFEVMEMIDEYNEDSEEDE